jgi:hypothetical protein
LPNKAKQRFIDLAVAEVSVVDTPANEVEFLVLKRLEEDDEMPDAENKPTETPVADKSPEVITVDANKAASEAVEKAMAQVTSLVEGIAKAAGAKPAPTPPAAAEVDPEDARDDEVEKAAKGMGAMRKTMRAQLKAHGVTGEAMTKAMAAFDKCLQPPAADTQKAEADTQKSATPAPAASTPATAPEATEDEAAQVLAQKALEHLATQLGDVAKAKSMTPKRQEQLKSAISSLQKLLEDLGGAQDPAATTTPASPKQGESAVAELTKALEKGLADLRTEVTKTLTEVTTKVEDTSKRVKEIEDQRPAPTALPTEETDTRKAGRKSMWSGVL